MQREIREQPFAWLPAEKWDACIVPVIPGAPPAAEGRCDACGETGRVVPVVVEQIDMRLCVVTAVCARRTAAALVTS